MFNKVKVLSTLLVLLPVLGMASTQIKCPSAAAVKNAIPFSAKKVSTGNWAVVSLIPDSQYSSFMTVSAGSQNHAIKVAAGLLKNSKILSWGSRSDICAYVGFKNHHSYKIVASKK